MNEKYLPYLVVIIPVLVIGGFLLLRVPQAQACHGDCPYPGAGAGCAQACDEGGMAGYPYCLENPPANGYLTNFGPGKIDGNPWCGGAGNCVVQNCFLDFACDPGFSPNGGGCEPSCVAQQGQACQSGPNVCGMRNSGTIQCNGSCSAGPPSDLLCTQGSFEGFIPSCVNATGWSWDQDAPDLPVPVKLYDKDLAVFPAATPVAVLSPTTYRADLDNSLNGNPSGKAGNGDHAFNWPVPLSYKDNVARTFYGYAVNINGSGAPAGSADIPIGSHPLQCNNPPALAITDATCAPDPVNTTITVTGTATDAPAAGAVTVKLYQGTATPANLLKTGSANPGFSLTGGVGAFVGGNPVNYTVVTEASDAQGGLPVQDTRLVTCNPPAPTVTLNAVPPAVAFGGTTTVTWSSTNATGCTASDGSAGWSGPRPPAGSFGTAALAVSTTYTLTCINAVSSAIASVTVAVGAPPAPTVTLTTVDQPDYCQLGPEGIATWQYQSTADLPQAQWRMQVATDAGFGTIVYDSGVKPTMRDGSVPVAGLTHRIWRWLADLLGGSAYALSSTYTAGTGQGVLGFGTTYWLRAQAWDTTGTASAWSAPLSFSTPAGPYPRAGLSIDPPKPAAKQTVTFTDTSDYAGAAALVRTWDFGDGTVLTENPGAGTATHVYTDPSAGITATLTVSSTASTPKTCSATASFNVNKPIPSYREVLPGLSQ